MSAPTAAARPARPALRASQRAAEAEMIARFASSGDVPLATRRITLSSGSAVQVDGVDVEESLFVEAHAVAGPLRDIDVAVIAQDVFKLSLVKSVRPHARAVMLLSGDEVRDAVAARVARTPAAGTVEFLVV